jgi:aryl-alcohol dehydrogenase-like predicted oxidoreductase
MVNKINNKLSLGTVQFGLNYGVTNKSGVIGIEDINKIIKLLRKNGIKNIDTAPNYGDAEKKLGRLGISDFQVCSKVSKIVSQKPRKEIFETINRSLRDLKINKLEELLMHHPWDLRLEHGRQVIGALKDLKDQGLVNKIGVSVYNPDEALEFLDIFDFDVIQAPVNILDQRFLEEGFQEVLSNKNVELHARSPFLQGLLLDQSDHKKGRLSDLNIILEDWREWLKKNELKALDAALSFVVAQPLISKVIFGVSGISDFVEITNANYYFNSWPDFNCSSNLLLDPRNW